MAVAKETIKMDIGDIVSKIELKKIKYLGTMGGYMHIYQDKNIVYTFEPLKEKKGYLQLYSKRGVMWDGNE